LIKRIIQNATLVVLGSVAGLLIVEAILVFDGRYQSLVTQKLVPAAALWERPTDTIEQQNHPDLKISDEIKFDSDGVRNHSAVRTSQKRNIIGFFGDSFTENRRLQDRFAFTTLLDASVRPNGSVVNYGVDAYGLDQSYLRYRKYAGHDIKHVVYVFCENDLRNLYENALTGITADGEPTFLQPRVNPLYRFIGRWNTTYLVIASYYQLKGMVAELSWTDSISRVDWSGRLLSYKARFHDSYADSIDTDFLSNEPSEQTSRLADKFLLFAQAWKREVEAAGRTFTILVLPRPLDTEVGAKLFRHFDGNVIFSGQYFGEYSRYRFRLDDHWNENGNLKAAEFILGERRFPFHKAFKDGIQSREIQAQIDQLYREHEAR
jgi:hypothetical protein